MAKEAIAYDATVIQEFAQRLYSQAASIVLTTAITGVIVGAVVGLLIAAGIQARGAIGILAIIGAIIGGVLGYGRGREKAFKLRLDAQVALCQVQIERNTKGA